MHKDGFVDILHAGRSGYGFGKSPMEVRRFQTFIAPPACVAAVDICLKLRRMAGDPSDCPVIELYATRDGKPTGAALAGGGPCRVGAAFEVKWTSLISSALVPGQEYAVVLGTTSHADPAKDSRFEWAVAPACPALHFGKWDGHPWVDESGLGSGWMQIGVRDADCATDLTHSGTAGNAFGQGTDQIKRFQTFLARGANPIVGVDVRIRALQGPGQTDIVVELYDTAGHLPTGSPLAAAVINSSAVTSNWTVVNAPLRFPKPVFEHEYAVVLSQRTAGTALYEWSVGKAHPATTFGKWNGSSWLNESGLGNGWLRVWLMPSEETVQTCESLPATVHGNGFGARVDEIKRYQTFTLPGDRSISGVDLKVRRFNGTAQSDLVAELYATTGRKPTGPALASAVCAASQIGQDWSLVHVPLTSARQSAGTYALVLTQSHPADARYEWAVGAAAATGEFGKWNGSTWVDESGLGQAWMRVWTAAANGYLDSAIDVTHSATNGYGFGNSADEIKRFQTIYIRPVAGNCWYDVHGVQLKVRRFNGNAQSDLIVELFGTTKGLPSGLPMATAVVPSGWIGTGWTTVSVPLYYVTDFLGRFIQQATTYAIVVSQRNPGPARYEWATGRTNVNYLQFGKWNGSAWVDESGLGYGWLKVCLLGRESGYP